MVIPLAHADLPVIGSKFLVIPVSQESKQNLGVNPVVAVISSHLPGNYGFKIKIKNYEKTVYNCGSVVSITI